MRNTRAASSTVNHAGTPPSWFRGSLNTPADYRARAAEATGSLMTQHSVGMVGSMPKLRNPIRRTYTPNQIVALNVGRARALRGWTQEQAAQALAPYLGAKWSNASFSAVERSIAGTRVKQFSADELVALSRGFDLPLGWFFTPPPPHEDAGVHVPDAGMIKGTDPQILLDIVLGTDTNRE